MLNGSFPAVCTNAYCLPVRVVRRQLATGRFQADLSRSAAELATFRLLFLRPIMLIAHRFQYGSEIRATACFDAPRGPYSVAGIAEPRSQARATKAAAPSISGK